MAVATDPGASWLVTSPADADMNTVGHQVALSAGANSVTVTVTAEDGTTKDYTVSVNRGVTDAKGWQAGADLDGLIAAGNTNPVGVWSNDTTIWVADWGAVKLFAYTLEGGARDDARDIMLASSNFWSGRHLVERYDNLGGGHL